MSSSSGNGARAISPTELTSPPPPDKKRHKLTPHEQQAQAIEKLLANPEKEVRIPGPAKEKTLRPPREMMKNVAGSSAGAGSGEFHVYKHARRREYERIRLMEEKASKVCFVTLYHRSLLQLAHHLTLIAYCQQDAEKTEFARKHAAQAALDQAKTDKNRAKREKKKLAALKAKAAAKGEDPRKVKVPGVAGTTESAQDDADGPMPLNNDQVERIQFKRPDQPDEEEDDDDE